MAEVGRSTFESRLCVLPLRWWLLVVLLLLLLLLSQCGIFIELFSFSSLWTTIGDI